MTVGYVYNRSSDMQMCEETIGETVLLALSGRLDASTAAEFERKLAAVFDNGGKWIVADLLELDYVSSAGLRALLVGAKRASKENGKLSICCMQEQVREVFDVAGFSSLFPTYDTREEALKETYV